MTETVFDPGVKSSPSETMDPVALFTIHHKLSQTSVLILKYLVTKYSMLNSYSSSLFSSFQFSHSVVSDSLWPMDCRMPGLPVHHQLQEFTQTHVHRVSDAIKHLILCRPLLPPSSFPSIRVFSNESVLLIRWPKYWSLSFKISLSNEHSQLISL